MQPSDFKPGFRLSVIDVVVLIAGAIGSVLLSSMTWWWGFVVAFVIGHFFLFCNFIRASRPLELCWSAVFVALAIGTIIIEFPGWLATALLSLGATTAVVILEMRKPSYHGIGWQRINPALPAWWEVQAKKTIDASDKG
jgi:hypothetical protein